MPAGRPRQWEQTANTGSETAVNSAFNYTSGREGAAEWQLVIQEIPQFAKLVALICKEKK